MANRHWSEYCNCGYYTCWCGRRGWPANYGKRDPWECIDLKCAHFDGDRCVYGGFCDPDPLDNGDLSEEQRRQTSGLV